MVTCVWGIGKANRTHLTTIPDTNDVFNTPHNSIKHTGLGLHPNPNIIEKVVEPMGDN